VAWSPDGNNIAVGDAIWGTATGHLVRVLDSPKETLSGVAFGGDGMLLAIWNENHLLVPGTIQGNPITTHGWIKVWVLASCQETTIIDEFLLGGVSGIAFSPDGKYLAAGSGTASAGTEVAGIVCVWDIETGRRIYWLKGHSHSVWNVAFSPDGKR